MDGNQLSEIATTTKADALLAMHKLRAELEQEEPNYSTAANLKSQCAQSATIAMFFQGLADQQGCGSDLDPVSKPVEGPTLWRAVDALGGTGAGAYHAGYSFALEAVLAILERRGFTEQADAQ